jgi:hypothetical protein
MIHQAGDSIILDGAAVRGRAGMKNSKWNFKEREPWPTNANPTFPYPRRLAFKAVLRWWSVPPAASAVPARCVLPS